MTAKIKIQLGSIGILVVVVISLIASQSASPDFPPFFGIKRVQEKAFLNLKSGPQQVVDYKRNLLNTRLEELSSQVKRKSYGYILPSAQRYSTLAGEITETVISSNMKDQIPSIINQFNDHKKVLQNLYVIYPKNTDNWEWKYIQDDMNYLDLYLDKLSKIE